MENKDTRMAFEEKTGRAPGSLDVGAVSTFHPKAFRAVAKIIGKMQVKRITPHPFPEFGSGKIKMVRGEPQFELLMGKLS